MQTEFNSVVKQL